jgi:hypothetical protein
MSPFLSRLLISLAMLAVAAGPVRAADAPAPPAAFTKLVPAGLRDGLKLVEVKQRCEDCPPWRVINFMSNASPEPVRKEQVSVRAGVRAIYAFPDTAYFANVKVEQSMPGKYAQDKAIVVQEVEHEYTRRRDLVDAYLATNPAIRAKLDRAVAKGKPYLEFEKGTYKGYEYVSYTENAIGLTSSSSTLSQVQIFVPQNETIVTAYLLFQKAAKFRTIDEFLALRREFIEGYIDFLSASAH